MTSIRNVALALALGAGLLASTRAEAGLSLNFASIANAKINFTPVAGSPGGADITFTSAPSGAHAGFGFLVTNVDNGVGTIVGEYGKLTGTYHYDKTGANGITTVGTTQSAPVTTVTPGEFSITDGSGFVFKGTVAWVKITQTGSGVSLNTEAVVNLTNLTYTGADADLIYLRQSADSLTLSFSFNPALTLTSLASGTTTNSTSYSGVVVTAVPEPGTIVAALAGLPLLGLGLLRRRAR